MGRGRSASGLGAIGLTVLTVVAVGCGSGTAPLDRDGGFVAAPATTTDGAPRTQMQTPAPTDPAPTDSPSSFDQTEAEAAPLPSPLSAPLPVPLDPEVPVPDEVSINAARVVINQSNVAVNTGGSSSSSSSSARSVVESDAAVLVVQETPSGIEVVSLDVRPGWVEAARSQTPQRLSLRYVLGTNALDISVWTNGSGLASSVSSSFDR